MKAKFPHLLVLLPALAAGASTALASEATARAQSAVSEIQGDVAKAALSDLDAEMDRLEVLIDSAPTAEEKEAARLRLEALKERRAELRKTYVKARYEELKADVRAEANRIGAWTKRTFSSADDKVRDTAAAVRSDTRESTSDLRREGREARRELRNAGNETAAAATSAAAGMNLASYKLRPTDTDKSEARAALKALDARIEQLEDRIDAMPSSATRDAAERRVKALEDRKDELKGDNFNKQRFNTLVDEVEAEFGNLR